MTRIRYKHRSGRESMPSSRSLTSICRTEKKSERKEEREREVMIRKRTNTYVDLINVLHFRFLLLFLSLLYPHPYIPHH